MGKRFIAAVFLALAAWATAVAAYSVTFNNSFSVVRDTYIENLTGLAHGSDASLLASDGAATHFNRSLLWFDLDGIPASASVSMANLSLFQEASTGGTATVSVHNASAEWSESANWTHRLPASTWIGAGGDYNATALASTSVLPANQYWGFNVTSQAAEWVLGNSPNNGFFVIVTSADRIKQFSSSQSANSSRIPRLEVAFTSANFPALPTSVSSNVTSTLPLRPVLHSVRWLDYTGGLSGYVFSSNYSGSWANDSFAALSGAMNWSNYSRAAPAAQGAYAWRVFANDSENAFNSSPLAFITVTANTFPSVASASVLPSNPVTDDALNCSWVISDPDAGQVLAANVTWFSDGANQPAYNANAISCVNGSACYTGVAIPSSATAEGQEWKCQVTAYDDLGGTGIANGTENVNYFVSLQPDASEAYDTYIDGNGEADFSAAPNLTAGYEGIGTTNQSALLFFDLYQVKNATIRVANLSLFLLSFSTGGANITAHNVSRQWNASATWITYDGVSNWTSQGGDYGAEVAYATVGSIVQPYYLNLSALAQWWYNSTNNGVMVRQNTSTKYKAFYSFEESNQSRRPTLSLKFLANNSVPIPTRNFTNNTNVVVTAPLLHSVRWVDYTGGLSGYVFSSNYSGSGWANETFVAFSGNVNWSNYSRLAASSPGTYAWQVYANDSSNSFNASPMTFQTVVANTLPSVSAVTVYPAIAVNSSQLNCSWAVTDPDAGQVLSANATWHANGVLSTFFNTTGTLCANNTICYASANVTSSNLTSGDFWECRVSATDSLGVPVQNSSGVSIAYQRTVRPSAADGIDTYIISNDGTGHGTVTNVTVMNYTGGPYSRALIYFNMTPLSGVTVYAANLTLYQALIIGSGTVNVSAHNVTAAWNESANWTHPNLTGAWAAAGGDFMAAPANWSVVGGAQGYYYWNVTGLALEWVAGTNNGLLLKSNETNTEKAFYSTDYADNPARTPALDLLFKDTKPTITNVTASPRYASDDADLNCSFFALDQDTATLRSNFTWFKNGAQVAFFDANFVSCSNATNCFTTTAVGNSNTTNGDLWKCQVTVFDNAGGYSMQNASANVTYLQSLQPGLATGQDNTLWQAAATTGYGQGDSIIVSGGASSANRTVIRFSTPSVPINSTVVNATLSLYAASVTGTPNVTVYLLSRQFNGSATWNAYDGSNGWTGAGGDYNATLVNFTTIASAGANYTFNLTSVAQQWVDNDSVNYGVLLKLADESASAGVAFTSSNESAQPQRRPLLDVRYVETPNNAPSLSSVSVVPASPNDTVDLNCSWAVTNDEPGQSLKANVTWWNGSLTVSSNDSVNVVCANSTTCYATTALSSFLTNKNEAWKCQVTATDSLGKSDRQNSSAATIQNTVPAVPSLVTPTNGSFDEFLYVTCSGSTDVNQYDYVRYNIDAYYDGAWSALAANSTGAYNWSLLSVNRQSGVDLRCNATDGDGSSSYLFASNFTSNQPNITVAHGIEFSSQQQVGNATVGSRVLFSVNVSGVSAALCNYTSLPTDRAGALYIRNDSSLLNVSIANTTGAAWWNCTLLSNNYTVFFETPAPALASNWAQNGSRSSDFATQYVYDQVTVTNPSANNSYSNVFWNITCFSGFSCSATQGFVDVPNASSVSFNISASGDGVSDTVYPLAQNTTVAANLTADRQKIYRGFNVTNNITVTLNLSTGASAPPASCWNSTASDDSPVAFITVPTGSADSNDSVYWVGDCIANTTTSFNSSGTASNYSVQVIRRFLNFTNVGGMDLAVNWTVPAEPSSCWTVFNTSGSLTVPNNSIVTFYANQSGDCLDVTDWVNYSQNGPATFSVQSIKKSRNVTNNASIALYQAYWIDPDAVASCWTGFQTNGTFNAGALSVSTVNMTHQGDCLNESDYSYAAYPAEDGYYNTTMVVVRGNQTVSNLDNHTFFSGFFSSAGYPASCFTFNQLSGTFNASAGSNVTIQSNQSGPCVTRTSSSWVANYSANNTFSNQSIIKPENVTNQLNFNLSPLIVNTTAPGSAWQCYDCAKQINLTANSTQLVYLSAWGDVLNESYGDYALNNTESLASADGGNVTLVIARSFNVSNNGSVELKNISTGFSSYSRPPGNWTCGPQTVNVSTINLANRFWESCNSNDTVVSAFSAMMQDPNYPVSADSGYARAMRLVNITNYDYGLNFTNINWSITPDAGWTGNRTTGLVNLSSNSSASDAFTQYRASTDLFRKSFNVFSSGQVVNASFAINNTGTVNFTNVTSGLELNDSTFDSVTGLFALNGSGVNATYAFITPASFDATCTGASPSYAYYFVNDGSLGVCKADRNSNGIADYFKFLFPHFSSWNFTVMEFDSAPPSIINSSPSGQTNRTPAFSAFSNEPAVQCRGILDADANYTDMTLNFTASPLSSLSSQLHSYSHSSSNLSYGAHSVFVRCADYANNTANSSHSWGFEVVVICGNGFCEAVNETCGTCAADCGACPTPAPSTGGGGGSGGGGGGGGSAGTAVGPVATATPVLNVTATPTPTPAPNASASPTPASTPSPTPKPYIDAFNASRAISEARRWQEQLFGKNLTDADVEELLKKAQESLDANDYEESLRLAEEAKVLAKNKLRAYYLELDEENAQFRRNLIALLIIFGTVVYVVVYRKSAEKIKFRFVMPRIRVRLPARPRTLKELAAVQEPQYPSAPGSPELAALQSRISQSRSLVSLAWERLRYRHADKVSRLAPFWEFANKLLSSVKAKKSQETPKENSAMRDFLKQIKRGEH